MHDKYYVYTHIYMLYAFIVCVAEEEAGTNTQSHM